MILVVGTWVLWRKADFEAALIRRCQISHYSDYILCKIIRHICGPLRPRRRPCRRAAAEDVTFAVNP